MPTIEADKLREPRWLSQNEICMVYRTKSWGVRSIHIGGIHSKSVQLEADDSFKNKRPLIS
jgi:hypothetical protein